MRKILSVMGVSFLLCACQPGNLNHQIATGNDESAKAMIQQGQGINALDFNGTPLCAAASVNNVEMTKYLIARGADINAGNEDGYLSKSPLHSAAGAGAVDVAKLLLANGADTLTRNRENLTPLETAQAEGQVEMVELLSESERISSIWDQTVELNTAAGYQRFIADFPDTAYQQTADEKIATLAAIEARQQNLDELEASLPVNVRRDKYMVQLSRALKFFYGEALLKTSQPGKALEQFYQYVNEQGSGATHYARALELMNQAESQL
jgi:hypothetical protein